MSDHFFRQITSPKNRDFCRKFNAFLNLHARLAKSRPSSGEWNNSFVALTRGNWVAGPW